MWDRTTPPEEVLRTLTDAVRAGKILHYGFIFDLPIPSLLGGQQVADWASQA